MPAVPSSPCPRPRPASGVQCPVRATSVHAWQSTRRVSSVRCGRLSVHVSGVQVSGVQVSVSGVCAFPRPRCPAQRGRGARRRGRPPHGWHGQGRRGRPMRRRPARGQPESERAARSSAQAVLRPAEVSVWTWPSSWAVVGQWPDRPRGRLGEAGCARGSFVGGEPGCAARLASCDRLRGTSHLHHGCSLVDPSRRSPRLGGGGMRLPVEPPVPVGRPPWLLVL
jgi:hypothetical protein